MTAPPIEPDTKDWTWVLREPCPECGFVSSEGSFAEVSEVIRSNAALWATVLAGPTALRRPRPDVWSPTEYACHVRDVHRIFSARVRSMLVEDGPRFDSWDQDETALAERYDQQDPSQVAADLAVAAADVADLYDDVAAEALTRPGYRSDGSEFTVDSIARYHLHDVVHHAWDVRRAVTVAGYDAAAAVYSQATAPLTDRIRGALDSFAADLGPGARVLEIGSGGGRDAAALEGAGLSVRRTDVTPAFVEMLGGSGHEAALLDPLTDDLADPARPGAPYDGVWANASLLHVARADLPEVLSRLASSTRLGGVLRMTVKEGAGEGWSTHGAVATPRMFTYWREEPLRAALTSAGWSVSSVLRGDGQRGAGWLDVTAQRSAAGAP